MKAWVNGQVLESPEIPAIGVLDHGLVVGDGVFETVKVENGKTFALTQHLDRLVRSAEGLGIGTPDLGLVREGVLATIGPQELPFGRVRITVTSGPGPLGSPRGSGDMTMVVVTEPCDRPPSVSRIVTVPWPRNERGALVGLKTTSYAENALMVEHAKVRGASEAVMPNTRGHVCEGTGSNIVYVLDGRVITPPLSAGPLAGVTRALLLEWAAGQVEIHEEDHPIETLSVAEEVMLVGTTRDVQAIDQVDGRTLPAPGPLTRRLQDVWTSGSTDAVELWGIEPG